MTSCGFGFVASKAAPPLECVVYNNAGKLISVKENDPSEICKSAKCAVPSNSLTCYECGCDQNDIAACNCSQTSTEFDGDYCVIGEERLINGTTTVLTRIDQSIRYNQTADAWYTWTEGAIFACDWDFCNSPNLINALPASFQLNIDKDWLDTNIYGNGSVTECHHCPFVTCGDSTNPINFTECPMTSCDNETTCLAFDLWTDLETNDQCYQSQCVPENPGPTFDELYGGRYRIDVDAIVYLA
ncbi:unnamed protein product, partial [Rotaria sordida]